MKKIIVRLIARLRENFVFVAIASFLWLLYRTGTKPSRFSYPCQKAATINVATFVYLAPILYGHKIKQFLGAGLISKSLVRYCLIVLALLSAMFGSEFIWAKYQSIKGMEKLEQHRTHLPVGISSIADGSMRRHFIHDHEYDATVVSVRDTAATNWDHETGYWWEYIDQEVVDEMVQTGLTTLTEEATVEDAWRALIPYQAGEIVVIKLNFNNTYACDEEDNGIDAYAELCNTVIDGLTSIGVPDSCIWFLEAVKRIPNRFIDNIMSPDVRYFSCIYQNCACNGHSYSVTFVDPDSPEVSGFSCTQGNLPDDVIRPAQVLVDADHLINVPIFKSHGSYITLALKNHYGSVNYDINTLQEIHDYFNANNNPMGCPLETENVLADINNNPNIRDKTRLVIGDGLFGNPYTHWQSVERWEIFGDDDPNILFFSTDPVAISSVMTDYIMYERGWQDHEQLHAGAYLDLGVHEHWNNDVDKEYTSIEYIQIDMYDE